ncbi:rod shape-determining protein MreC [Gynuella sp.]|uniref:rod shape-determining protein MreC n=1 Tax=Gynuella sp. TaxID=2969146 RepID=UPI003D0C0259
MKSIFSHGPHLGYRFLFALLLSGMLMFADLRIPQTDKLKQILGYPLTPILWIANVPSEAVDWSSSTLASREKLMIENESLKAQVLMLQRKTQQLPIIQAENRRLRELVNASEQVSERILAAQLIGLDTDAFSHQVIINKGSEDGVFVGQPVLDATGLMGQVIQIDTYTSRVLLIADANHAVPVEVNRNGLRGVVSGTGDLSQLELIYVPDTADIQVGDLLVTSGLGGRFPQGYPVAVVDSVEHDPGEPFAIIKAKPSAHLNRSKHVLLVFNGAEKKFEANQSSDSDATQ